MRASLTAPSTTRAAAPCPHTLRPGPRCGSSTPGSAHAAALRSIRTAASSDGSSGATSRDPPPPSTAPSRDPPPTTPVKDITQPTSTLSPQGFLPNVSGVSVEGFSPTSMQGWQTIKATLQRANVKMLSAQEVVFAMDRGVPVIDVRPTEQYDKGHIPGAANVPFFRPITGWEPIKVLRRVGYALFGVLNGTEVNPDFTRDASALVDPQLGAVLYCSMGGTLEPTEGSKKGLQSRSLIAAWQLVANGVKNVAVMKGGFSEWVANGRDVAVMVPVDE